VDFGKSENPNLEWYISEAINGALNNTKTPAAAVDKMWIGNFCGELFSNQGHLGAAAIGAHPHLLHKPSMRVEGACASGGLAFACALDSIQAGSSNVALVVGAEVQTSVSSRVGGDYLARASHYRRQRGIDDFTFPALFARRVKACQEELGYTPRDLGMLSAKAYANANNNPLAHMHHVTMNVDVASSASELNPTFLGNVELHSYLRVSDCSQVSDGGAALVLLSEDGLQQLGIAMDSCVEVKGFSVATGNLYEDSDLTTLHTTQAAAQRAFAQSGVPPSLMGVAEVHDCFTVTEMLMLEALGIAPRGGGAHMVRNGDLLLSGKLPCNTGGGLVGFGHPVGATGVKQLLEIHKQMKGLCDKYQMADVPQYGVAANMGGDDKTAVVTVLENC
jgi:acetyl-CoA acyltransferase